MALEEKFGPYFRSLSVALKWIVLKESFKYRPLYEYFTNFKKMWGFSENCGNCQNQSENVPFWSRHFEIHALRHNAEDERYFENLI